MDAMQDFEENVKFVQEHGIQVEVEKNNSLVPDMMLKKVNGADKYMERHKDKIEKIREAKRNDNEIHRSKKELKEFTERINHIREKKKKELTIDEFNELIARFNGRNTV